MELLQQLKHLPAFFVDIARLCVWLLLLMAIFVPLERLFSAHPQKIFRKFFFRDLGYYFLSGVLPKILLVIPMAMIAWVLHRIVPGEWHTWVNWAFIGAIVGLTKFPFCGAFMWFTIVLKKWIGW